MTYPCLGRLGRPGPRAEAEATRCPGWAVREVQPAPEQPLGPRLELLRPGRLPEHQLERLLERRLELLLPEHQLEPQLERLLEPQLERSPPEHLLGHLPEHQLERRLGSLAHLERLPLEHLLERQPGHRPGHQLDPDIRAGQAVGVDQEDQEAGADQDIRVDQEHRGRSQGKAFQALRECQCKRRMPGHLQGRR